MLLDTKRLKWYIGVREFLEWTDMRKNNSRKLIIIILVVVLVLAAVLIIGGDSIMRRSFIVGRNIKESDLKEFWYTVDASTDPPRFMRYRFYEEGGKHWFYGEQRQGDHWPLTEADILLSGTVELTAEQWLDLFALLSGGTVVKRTEHLESGNSGPWLFLYWSRDRGKYQEFSFASGADRKAFENLAGDLFLKAIGARSSTN